MIYEALVTVEGGEQRIGTVEAEDRNEAKYEFAHSVKCGDKFIVRVDYRTVKLERKERADGK